MPCSRSQGVSQHASQVSRPTPKGEVDGSGQGGLQGPHLGGLQTHTQVGCLLCWVSPGPHPGGAVPGGACSRGICFMVGSAPGVCGDPPVMATSVGDTHPTGMHSCSYVYCID